MVSVGICLLFTNVSTIKTADIIQMEVCGLWGPREPFLVVDLDPHGKEQFGGSYLDMPDVPELDVLDLKCYGTVAMQSLSSGVI